MHQVLKKLAGTDEQVGVHTDHGRSYHGVIEQYRPNHATILLVENNGHRVYISIAHISALEAESKP